MGSESRDEGDQAEALCFEDAAERELWLSFFRDDLQTEPLPKYAALAADERLAEVRRRSGPSKAERIVEMLRTKAEEVLADLRELEAREGVPEERWHRARAVQHGLSFALQKAEALLE